MTIEQQIELEKRMTQASVEYYQNGLERAKQSETFSTTPVATKILQGILDRFQASIEEYVAQYGKGNAVKSTLAARTIQRLDSRVVAYIAAKTILNSVYSVIKVQKVYKAIGLALESEYKMLEYKAENIHYYETIQKDLNKRGAKTDRKRNITMGVFNKRLEFFIDNWTHSEKVQTGLILLNLFIQSTGLVVFQDLFKNKKTERHLIATPELLNWIESTNEKLEVMQPFFLPMVCEPADWIGVLDGGYISPYIKRNMLIKNNSKGYLKKLQSAEMPEVYSAINTLQKTPWKINTKVLEVVQQLWDIGEPLAGLPDREDVPLIPFPFPDYDKETQELSEEDKTTITNWKRETYELHKQNIKKRSLRILTSQILNIASDFSKYEKIWFPHQMDFRGRLYPIPVLLQPQGGDLAKGLLHFGEGKLVDEKSINWLRIHGANMWGNDKVSYEDRIKWVLENEKEIKSYAEDPIYNRGWIEADKPFQFLAWVFDYVGVSYGDTSVSYTYIPIQLDGTCNGLQHYSALLKDEVGGRSVNLTNSDIPSDIYGVVAETLKEKLNDELQCNRDSSTLQLDSGVISNSKNSDLAGKFLSLGINRKLTKRPVMVLPYGGTRLSCRAYIEEYLRDTYSLEYIFNHFQIGSCPQDCVFKVASWLSKYLWESIEDNLKAAVKGMDYLRKIVRMVNSEKHYIEWLTPSGLLIRQAYRSTKEIRIETELFGKLIKTRSIKNSDELDKHKQANGVCPNFIHSLDASCLMKYLCKCKAAGITSYMAVHDCYGTLAPDCDISARLLRESFVEIYRQDILKYFVDDVLLILREDITKFEQQIYQAEDLKEKNKIRKQIQKLEKLLESVPEHPEEGSLDIEEVLESEYFFN